jgi:hypothetical protein
MSYQCQTNQPGLLAMVFEVDSSCGNRIASLAQDTKQRSLADSGWKTGDRIVIWQYDLLSRALFAAG